MAHQWRPPSWLRYMNALGTTESSSHNHVTFLHIVHKVRKEILCEMLTLTTFTAFL